jgi:hypothetical protein
MKNLIFLFSLSLLFLSCDPNAIQGLGQGCDDEDASKVCTFSIHNAVGPGLTQVNDSVIIDYTETYDLSGGSADFHITECETITWCDDMFEFWQDSVLFFKTMSIFQNTDKPSVFFHWDEMKAINYPVDSILNESTITCECVDRP